MKNTLLDLQDSLPLTCSRAGTCCHGNLVRLNPWELARLAHAKNLSPLEFRNTYTRGGGSILHFGGVSNRLGKQACGLYAEGKGCKVHPTRPLACRLFPLGRQIQNEQVTYLYQGNQFPCLKECPEVLELPKMKVEDYLKCQETSAFEKAQDEYLEVMQQLADIALTLLLDTGLAESGDTKTLANWRKLGTMDVDHLVKSIGDEWHDLLTIPNIENCDDPVQFAQVHNTLLQSKAQELVDSLTTLDAVREACELTMAMALFLAHSLGADAHGLSEHWIAIAKENGAMS